MKFAINTYASFENSQFDHILRLDEVFVVTPEFEENPAFIEGLRVGSFKFIEIETMGELKRVIGVTDEMIEEFESNLEVEEIVEEVVAEAIPEEVPEEVEPGPESEPAIPTPDIDGMKYRDLQAYALELEKKYGKDIDRSQKMKPLRASVKKLLEEMKG